MHDLFVVYYVSYLLDGMLNAERAKSAKAFCLSLHSFQETNHVPDVVKIVSLDESLSGALQGSKSVGFKGTVSCFGGRTTTGSDAQPASNNINRYFILSLQKLHQSAR